MITAPKVSVLTITYNHERYIEQTVRSALMQQTDFEYEIVIGEDCSTDRTRDVLLRLADECPDRLRLLFREQNLGGARNFADAFAHCRGEYIALLEGDDYWSDPQKLAKQVAFLDAHPEYSGCAHAVCPLEAQKFGRPYPDPCPETVTIHDLFGANPFHTCSVVYRKHFSRLPEWHLRVVPGDWPLHILQAIHGPFRVLPDVMAVYRVHPSGMWSHSRGRWRGEHLRRMYEALIAELPEYTEPLVRARLRLEYELAHQFAFAGDWPAARTAARKLVERLSAGGPKDVLLAVGALAHVLTPSVYRSVSQSWGVRPSRSQ